MIVEALTPIEGLNSLFKINRECLIINLRVKMDLEEQSAMPKCYYQIKT
jgi:hypothetical protein